MSPLSPTPRDLRIPGDVPAGTLQCQLCLGQLFCPSTDPTFCPRKLGQWLPASPRFPALHPYTPLTSDLSG